MIYNGRIKDRRHYKGSHNGYRAYFGDDLVFLGVKPYYGGEKWRVKARNAWYSADCDSSTTLTKDEIIIAMNPQPITGDPIVTYDWTELIVGDCVRTLGNNFAAVERNYSASVPSGLTSVELPDTLEEIAADAFDCQMLLTAFTMPSSVTAIGDGAFQYCTGITEFALMGQSHIETIGPDAFEGCDSLLQVILPSTVISIGMGAFEGVFNAHTYQHTPLLNVRRFILYATTPPNIANYAFGDAQLGYHPEFEGIYVPDASVNAYKAATNWTMYAEYIRPLSEYV